jgi:hypothetical protein
MRAEEPAMGQGNAVCPNCRQTVPFKGPASSPMLRCAACGLRFMPAQEGAYVELAVSSAPPPVRPANAQHSLPPNLVLHAGSSGPPTAGSNTAIPEAPSQPSVAGQRASRERRRPKGYGPLEIVKVVAGGAVGLGLGYLVVLALQRGREPESNQPRAAERGQPTVARAERQIEFPQYEPVTSAEPAKSTKLPPQMGFTPPPINFGPVGPAPLPPAASPSPAPRLEKHAGRPPAAEPAPSAPAQPLAGLAEVIKLPSLVDTAPVVLSRLHVPAGMTLGVSFNAVAANIPAEAAFLTEGKAQSPGKWLVCFLPDTDGSPNDKRVLAEMQHANGELSFVWRTPIEDADARKELSNCLLKLSCGDVAKTSLLRWPVEAPRLALDLQREVQTHAWAAVDLPKEESLRLEIIDLPGFPTGAKLKDDRRVLRLKERTTIQFEHVSGAEIEVEFRRVAENLQVVLRPEFRENAAEKFPMTLPRLADFKANLQKAIPEGEARIIALGKELKSLDRQLKDLGGRPASGPAFVAWQGRLRNLQSAASSAKSKMSRLQRQLPEMKARLANAPQLERFLGDLQSRGTLHVQLYAECGDARLVVSDMKLEPVAAE